MHVMLTVLGRGPRAAAYALGGREASAEVAPLALLELLPPEGRPDEVLALCTEEAEREAWPKLAAGLGGAIRGRPLRIPSGSAEEDLHRFLEVVTRAIPAEAGTALTVDVTHGYRHLSFLTYVAVLYLAALRGVEVRGAYYGLLGEGAAPFFDLAPLVALPRWVHAIQTLGETGSALPLARLLETGPEPHRGKPLAKELRLVSEAYLSGLPIELGQAAERFLSQSPKALRKLLVDPHRLPLAGELVKRLEDDLRPLAFDEPRTEVGWKGRVPLTEDELRRQARLVGGLLERGSSVAVRLMQEWTVSWAAWRLGAGERWLDFQEGRRSAGAALDRLGVAARRGEPSLPPPLAELGKKWELLTKLRNGFAHHGLRPQVLLDEEMRRELESLRAYWRETLSACPELDLRWERPATAPALLSPLGLSAGVLTSALAAVRNGAAAEPGALFLVCTPQSEPLAEEALGRAGWQGRRATHGPKDPHAGVDEVEGIAREIVRDLGDATALYVNVTGGTTLMGLVVERAARLASERGIPVRRFGLVDRRPRAEQEADPFREGEVFWID